MNNKTLPRSGGKILSFFKAKTVKICNKNTDLWTTINPRRRRGKFLKTTKTRREAAEFFLETTRPRTENPAKNSLRGGFKCYLHGSDTFSRRASYMLVHQSRFGDREGVVRFFKAVWADVSAQNPSKHALSKLVSAKIFPCGGL